MTRTGLVLQVPGGFVLNRDHLVFPAVELLDGLYGSLKQRIRTSITEWDGDVAFVGLFGSAARREGNDESDIDVLLISEDESADEFALMMTERLIRWTGNDCHVVVVTPHEIAEMQRSREPIVDDWVRDLDPIVGSVEDVFTTRSRAQ